MVAIQANGEIKVVEIVNLFEFTLHYIILKWCNNYLNNYLGVKFEKLAKTLCKWFKKVQNDEHVYMWLKNLQQVINEQIEKYYEQLLKLANSFQTKISNTFFIDVF
jgi:integrase